MKNRVQKTGSTDNLYGIHVVREAILAGRRRIHEVFIAGKRPSKRLKEVVELAESNRIPVRYVPADTMSAMVRVDHHQGVAARADAYPFVGLNRLMDALVPAGSFPFLLLLDHVVDPQNLGGLIRSASCVGIHGVIIPKDRSAHPTPTVSRASAGALEHMSVVMVTNLARTLQTLKERGVWIVGLDRGAQTSIFRSDLTGPMALVVGGEDKGVRHLVRKHCDGLVSIPQTGRIDSLNASVAGAVAMYEIYRQRHEALRRKL